MPIDKLSGRLRSRVKNQLDAKGGPGPFGPRTEEISLGERLEGLAKLGESAVDPRDPPGTLIGADLLAIPGSQESVGRRLAKAGSVLQRQVAVLTAVATTTVVSPVYSPLVALAAPIVTSGGDLLIHASCSFTSNGSILWAEIVPFLDGVVVPSLGVAQSNRGLFFVCSAAGVWKISGVSAGSHTMELRWAKTGFGPAGTVITCAPSVWGHASIVVEEIAI